MALDPRRRRPVASDSFETQHDPVDQGRLHGSGGAPATSGDTAARPAASSVVSYAQLLAGLTLFGVSIALMLAAGLGVDSWDVLHQGVAGHLDLSFGWVVNGVSLLALSAWIPLRQRPGIGTVANALIVGLVADATLAVTPEPERLPWQIVLLAVGIGANGLATGLYLGAGLGAGPRDGLMVGLATRTGRSIRLVRTSIEVVVLATGWVLGGPVGVGTVAFALAIGPLSQLSINRFSLPGAAR
jgi:uncharacterized membrane protein YczE